MSSDTYDWENITKFQVQVVTAIYVWGATENRQPIVTCGFLEDTDSQLYLPCKDLNEGQHAAEVAVELFRKYIAVDPRSLDIVPYGFFDPVRPLLDDYDKARRIIHLGYQTKIHPGTPVHPDLRFMTNEELQIARSRIARGHYEAYRTGTNG